MQVILGRVTSTMPGGPILERRSIRLVMRFAAVVGILVGIEAALVHLFLDPLGDVHAYYDAGARLNVGLPLYVQPGGIDDASFYRYPPLLAIIFRPLAMLPYEAAAAIWAGVVIGATLLTIRRLGLREPTFLVVAWLAAPIAWTVVIGQAQAVVTFLLAVGAPWAVAFAANLKIFPLLVAIYWVGRRQWRDLGMFAGWMVVLVVFQFVVEPAATTAYISFLSLDQVGHIANVSPYAISPVLWAASVAVMVLVAIRLAPTRWGWASAVVLSVFANPRLLIYQLSTLLAAMGGPSPNRSERDR